MILTYILLIVFSIAVLAIGLVNLVRVKTPEDYFVAGRRSGTFLTSGSFTATIIGGSSTMGLAGLAFSKGLVASWWLLVGVIGLLALIPFVKKIKSYTVYTLPELIGKWYGKKIRKIASILIALAWAGIVSAQIIAAAKLLSVIFPKVPFHNPLTSFTILVGTLFVLYTLAGGQISVIKTDFLQAILIVVGITGASLLGLLELGKISGTLQNSHGSGIIEGLHYLKRILKPDFLSFPTSDKFSTKDIVIMILVVGSTYTIGPDMMSRIFCSRENKTAKRAIATSILTLIPLAFIISMVGIEARVLFPSGKPEQSFPLMINNILPPLWAGLTVTALVSAFLSSADTTLLTLSAIVSLDILTLDSSDTRPHHESKVQTQLIKYRLITLLAGVISVGIALFSRGIIKSLLLSYTLFAGALTIPIIFALLNKPLSEITAIIAIVIGGVTAVYGRLTDKTWLILVSFALTFIIGITDRILSRRKQQKI